MKLHIAGSLLKSSESKDIVGAMTHRGKATTKTPFPMVCGWYDYNR